MKSIVKICLLTFILYHNVYGIEVSNVEQLIQIRDYKIKMIADSWIFPIEKVRLQREIMLLNDCIITNILSCNYEQHIN